jgi:threonine aldolase
MTERTTLVDLRSDTVTQPTPAMREAMMAAPLGDDVFGTDPSVNALQEKIAALLGFEAAMFVPTGTQSNLCAILSHCGRGDEYIVGQQAHCYRWEGGGAAVFGSVQPQPLDHAPDGTLPLAQIEAAIKPDDRALRAHALLALENTLGGKLLPFDYVQAATDLAKRKGLQRHLDGARLFNAATAQAAQNGRTDVRAEARRIAHCCSTACRCASARAWARPSVRRCRLARVHRARTPHPQDGGRRHAPGGPAGRGRLACARPPRRSPGRRPRAGAKAGAGARGHRGPEGGGAAHQHRVRRPHRRPAQARSSDLIAQPQPAGHSRDRALPPALRDAPRRRCRRGRPGRRRDPRLLQRLNPARTRCLICPICSLSSPPAGC